MKEDDKTASSAGATRRPLGRLLLLWALALGIVGSTVVLLKPGEPRVQGKKVSAWLEEIRYLSASPGQTVPRDDPAFVVLCNAGPDTSEALVQVWLAGHSDAAAARWGDDLRRLLTRGQIEKSRQALGWCAIEVLVQQGNAASNAVPALLQALGEGTSEKRMEAAWCLGHICVGAEQVVPRLMAELSRENTGVSWCAALALGRFGSEARPALPQLMRLRESGDRDMRAVATAAVFLIDPEQSDRCLDALIAELRLPAGERLNRAAWLIQEIGPSARRAVPALVDIIGEGVGGKIPSHEEQRAWDALKVVDPEAYQAEYEKRGGDATDRRWNRGWGN